MKPTPVEFDEPDDIPAWNTWVRDAIKAHMEQLEDEFGKFTTIDLPNTVRIILVPEGVTTSDEWQVCYPVPYDERARLVIDDYVPEAADED